MARSTRQTSQQRQGNQRQGSRPPEQFLELSDLLAYVGQVVERGIPGGVWVRCEISSLTDRRHLYLEVVQPGDDGREVAKCRATLWARERFSLEGRFKQATGGRLSAGLRVLLYVTPEFHPQYGFSLNIMDIAPEFTVGDLALRLDALRQELQAEGLFLLNRSLPVPRDYGRVGVLSPQGAAGLGDFRREADRLDRPGGVEFVYREALFQGTGAAASLLAALERLRGDHEQAGLDALCVIRGGGASADLAWLNDAGVARALARFPIPVITGIGHARDDTILDELACVRTDTPSKAALLIVGTVVNAAAQADADYRAVRAAVTRALVDADAGARWTRDRALTAARRAVELRAQALDASMSAVLGLTPARTLRRGYALVRGEGGQPVTRAGAVAAGERLTLEFGDGVVAVVAEGN